MNRDDGILFSGGAPGAEAEFGACAERHGIEEVNFTFDGHKIDRHRGVRVLNHEELQSGDVSLAYVSRLMHRRFTDAPTIRKVLQTLWYQVNSGQEIYVIGTVLDDGTVRGGTGWGAEFAKLCNKPLHVFDQDKNSWFTWTGEDWEKRSSANGADHHAPAFHRHRHAHDAGERQARDRGSVHSLVRRRDVTTNRSSNPSADSGLSDRVRRLCVRSCRFLISSQPSSRRLISFSKPRSVGS